jgi:hypothetical protein
METIKVKTNSFARRQTQESRFSNWIGTWESLESEVMAYIDRAKPGYRDGVMLVPLPVTSALDRNHGFFSGVVALKPDSKITTRFEARKPGEEPVIVVEAEGAKLPAKYVEIVIYRHDVLQEDGDGEHPGCWEIVSINASPLDHELPMDPVTMARNQLHKKGGTQGAYTPEQWAESVWFWASHAMVAAR